MRTVRDRDKSVSDRWSERAMWEDGEGRRGAIEKWMGRPVRVVWIRKRIERCECRYIDRQRYGGEGERKKLYLRNGGTVFIIIHSTSNSEHIIWHRNVQLFSKINLVTIRAELNYCATAIYNPNDIKNNR